MTSNGGLDYRAVALELTEALTTRDYTSAYAMTSQSYRKHTSMDQMRRAFEAIIPTDWGSTEPLTVVQTMTEWPEKQPLDLCRVYVSISGDVYSEAVAVVITLENAEPKVRDIEFGRP